MPAPATGAGATCPTAPENAGEAALNRAKVSTNFSVWDIERLPLRFVLAADATLQSTIADSDEENGADPDAGDRSGDSASRKCRRGSAKHGEPE